MTPLQITKATVLRALREEAPRLAGGSWITQVWSHPTVADVQRSPGECRVCAVGAVLLHALAPDAPPTAVDRAAWSSVGYYGILDSYLSLNEVRERALTTVAREPLTALSLLFEALYRAWWRSGDGELARAELLAELVAFVEDHFPEAFVLSVDLSQYAVRRGMELWS